MKNEKTTRAFSIALASITIFIWGITFISTKYLLRSFSALEILFFRFITAYISLWIINPHVLHLRHKSENFLYALAGLSGIVLYQFTENAAISYTQASNVSIIVSICPLFTAIISQIFLKEKHIGLFFILGFVLALTGVALISFNGTAEFSVSPKGDLLALCSGICWGFYSLFVSLINRLSYDTVCSTRRIFFFALIFMIPLCILCSMFGAEGSPFFFTFNVQTNIQRLFSLQNAANILFLGTGASALCFVMWNKSCAILGTVKVSAGIYLIPVVTIIFAGIFLKEHLSPMGIAGCVLTISGLFISEKGTSQK